MFLTKKPDVGIGVDTKTRKGTDAFAHDMEKYWHTDFHINSLLGKFQKVSLSTIFAETRVVLTPLI